MARLPENIVVNLVDLLSLIDWLINIRFDRQIIATNGFQWISVLSGMLNNILKVLEYQLSRWRPKWN